jgi:hypothetical protein
MRLCLFFRHRYPHSKEHDNLVLAFAALLVAGTSWGLIHSRYIAPFSPTLGMGFAPPRQTPTDVPCFHGDGVLNLQGKVVFLKEHST